MGTSVAIVSGKGGSGKTIIAAEIASLIARNNASVVLMDADTGTGGLSYYLGLKYVRNISEGFASFVLASIDHGKTTGRSHDVRALTQPLHNPDDGTSFDFLSIGDHRRLSQLLGTDKPTVSLGPLLQQAVKGLAASSDFLVVDCRGGVDDDSLAVCQAVDDIIMAVEADPTSFQASQHLHDVLTDNEIAYKLRGFIVNKAIQDPSSVASTTGVALRTRYLGAIPFDVDTARSFIVSELPRDSSIFGIHLRDAISRAYPKLTTPPPESRVWHASDYSSFNVYSPESTRAGLVLSVAMLVTGTLLVLAEAFQVLKGTTPSAVGLGVMTVLGVLAASEPFRQLLGRMLNPYRRILGLYRGKAR